MGVAMAIITPRGNEQRYDAPHQHANQHAHVGLKVPRAMAVPMVLLVVMTMVVVMVMAMVVVATVSLIGGIDAIHSMGQQVRVGHIQHDPRGKGNQVGQGTGGRHAIAHHHQTTQC